MAFKVETYHQTWGAKLRWHCITALVELMPLFPVPLEQYRKILLEDCQRRFTTGQWDYLEGLSEAHRFSIIAGISDMIMPGPKRVLDVGCGEGTLLKRMNCSQYIGLDLSQIAIDRARGIKHDAASFHLTTAEDYQPQGQFDVIVFNESLYYMPKPIEIFERYRKSLAPNGIIIVCMFQTYLAKKIWQRIAKTGIAELTQLKMINEKGYINWIKAYAEVGSTFTGDQTSL